jgi:iron complex transport system substrate-binding protein
VGYMRTLAAEGILSLQPDLIIASEESGPATTVQQLQAARIPIVWVPEQHSLQGVLDKINLIVQALHRPEAGQALIGRITEKAHRLEELLKRVSSKPRVLFIMNIQRGSLMAAGSKTAAHAMIELAGGQNVLTDVEGYKPISTESTISMNPDWIIMPSHHAERYQGIKGLKSIPDLASIPAVQQDHLIIMDSLAFLGFGPRFSESALELASTIHPNSKIAQDSSAEKSAP